MKRKHHTPEQIVRKLAEGEKLLNEGRDVAEVCRHLEITESTWHRWKNQYGGMKANDAKRLKELENENARLKRIVADQALDIDMLKHIAEGKFRPRTPAVELLSSSRRRSGFPSDAPARSSVSLVPLSVSRHQRLTTTRSSCDAGLSSSRRTTRAGAGSAPITTCVERESASTRSACSACGA